MGHGRHVVMDRIETQIPLCLLNKYKFNQPDEISQTKSKDKEKEDEIS
jgi:hypothetical protein